MKKIGIVTLFGNYNYGNRLQNYAVQEIVKDYGYMTETLVFSLDRKREFYRKCKRSLLRLKSSPEIKRYDTFSAFNKQMIPTRYIYAKNGVVKEEIRDQYSLFVVGSDQVWNPEIRQKERDIFFLSFANQNQRICISPSMGVSHIDECYYDIYQKGLRGFNYLCCREEEGKKEIERVSGKKCVRLIDPTMVLDSNQWRNFAKSMQLNIDKKYIICFFLGAFNKKLKSKIEQYAKSKGLTLFEVSSKEDALYSIDPRQLISLLDNAEMVFTDSFHMAAFSINLNKPFWVFDRCADELNSRTGSRIQTLVSLFGLSDRYVRNYDFDLEKKCNFSYANERLKFERDIFNDYLKCCFEQAAEY